MAESQFSTFFVRRPWPKLRIYLFLIFHCGRNTVFLIFCFSAMAEMKFLLLFTRPPRRKANFQHFFACSRGWRTIFHENWWFTPVFEQLFLKIVNLLSYLSSFFWKSAIYYRIWTDFFWKSSIYYRIWIVFPENHQFTIVSEQIFLKIVNLLSYLNSFSWKSSIYYRIWIVFPENHQFTIVSEQFFLKIDDLLSYLNRFFWKSMIYSSIWVVFFWKLMIYSRIWVVFPENW